MPAVERPQLRRFGVFELDLRAGELRRNGSKIKLQEQPFRILELLLQTPGEVVSRDELRSRLWPEDTFVDFDHSLNAAIRRLRDALGDSADSPRFVETVARRGYRFVAPVNGSAAPIAATSVVITQEPAPGHLLHSRWWLLGALFLLVVAVMVMLVMRRPHPEQPKLTQLTANPADDRVRAAAISPDGRYLAFADEIGFYLRATYSGETHSLAVPKEFGVSGASWFPDGAHLIVTLSRPGEKASLWDLSVLGGTVRKIAEEGAAPAVSPDGRFVAFRRGSHLRQELWIMAADGSQAQKLAGADGDYFGPVAWSPDSRRIAFARGRLTHGYGYHLGIELIDVGSRASRTLFSPAGLDLPLAWTSTGRLIYAQSLPNPWEGDSSLWWVPISAEGQISGAPARVATDPGAVAGISVSRDSKRMVILKGLLQSDVYVAKLENNGLRLSPPQRLTLDDRRDFPYDWTPDGKSVIFASDRTGKFSLYKQATDAAVPEMLAGGKDTLTLARLSPDGSQVLYLDYPPEGKTIPNVSLMRMPLVGGPPQRVLEAKSINNHQCARLPATVCVFSENRDAGIVFSTYDPMKGRGPQIFKISDDVTKDYSWSLSPDGATLAIARTRAAEEAAQVRLVSLNSGGVRWLPLEHLAELTNLDWAADNKSLWATSADGEGNALLNIDLQGHIRPVWQPQRMVVAWAIPSRDGRNVALQVSSGSANTWMLENF